MSKVSDREHEWWKQAESISSCVVIDIKETISGYMSHLDTSTK